MDRRGRVRSPARWRQRRLASRPFRRITRGLVVQTPRGDTAGGPLYLYDLATEQTTNLNEQSGLPSYNSISALKVVGWHPNNSYLLWRTKTTK